MAVLTNGELPIDSPMLRAALAFCGASYLDGDELGDALAVLGDHDREFAHHSCSLPEIAQRGSATSAMGAGQRRFSAPGGEHEHRVAGRRVAVDGHAVEAAAGAIGDELMQRRPWADRGVGEDEAQHRRHVRRDHAGALAEAASTTVAPPILALRVASLGKVSVVMRARPRVQASAKGSLASAKQMRELAGLQGSPITPVEARTSLRRRSRPPRRRRIGGDDATVSRPFLPVKALALPELTTKRARIAIAQARWRHQSTGAERVLERRQHAGHSPAWAPERRAASRCGPCSGYRPRPLRSARRGFPAARDRIAERAGKPCGPWARTAGVVLGLLGLARGCSRGRFGRGRRRMPCGFRAAALRCRLLRRAGSAWPSRPKRSTFAPSCSLPTRPSLLSGECRW